MIACCAQDWIRLLELEPLSEEGGWFREIYRAETGAAMGGPTAIGRALGSSIYYLIECGKPCLLHRLQQEELYFFLAGNPARLTLLPTSGEPEEKILGEPPALHACIPARAWQGWETQPGGPCDFTLFAITVCPAFQYADREMASRERLLKTYPGAAEAIRRLTPQ